MISKIYLVISCSGQYEEYYEKVEKAFKDVKKAEKYMDELEDQEENNRKMAERCMECAGLCKEYQCYAEPFDAMDECECYEPYHDNKHFRIDEVELEE